MALREQNGDFIYRLHLSMAITSPNLNFIPCMEVEISGGITPSLRTMHVGRCLPMRSYFIHHYMYPVICHSIAKHAPTFG